MEQLNPATEYARWLAFPSLAPELRAELEAIAGDEAAIADRFWRHLAFGTGGLRGEMGAGTNRMNDLTVARATRGLAAWLRRLGGGDTCVCIGHDTRHRSRHFARVAAGVLCGEGIRVFLFGEERPTPMLSYAVRAKGAAAGIAVTASHNPPAYNGYKVYGPDGGQITEAAAAQMAQCIDGCDILDDKPPLPPAEAGARGLLAPMGEDVDAAYYEKVKALALRPALLAQGAGQLRVLYTPLHGAGAVPVARILRESGHAVATVAAQMVPDGDFPTVPTPNPEDAAVFALALKQAASENPDLLLATDPDCDRIGVMARTAAGEYAALTGNQIGALLCEYIIAARKEQGTLPQNAAVVKTIVTTELARAVCQSHGVAVADTLTGFKYIGEKIGEWERSGAHSFLLGFEESFGYLAGTFVRDKDAVIAAALIAEMALYHKKQGRTLQDALAALHQQHGAWAEAQWAVTLPGQDGLAQMQALMGRLRENGDGALPGESVARHTDYLDSEATGLPASDVFKFWLADGSWVAVRPSGTEPKLKVYIGARGPTVPAATARLEALQKLAEKIIKP